MFYGTFKTTTNHMHTWKNEMKKTFQYVLLLFAVEDKHWNYVVSVLDIEHSI